MPFFILGKDRKMENKNNGVTTIKVVNGVKYDVEVHFSKTSKETLRDKLVKLIIRDYEKDKRQKLLDKS